jgi:hypothetical protein
LASLHGPRTASVQRPILFGTTGCRFGPANATVVIGVFTVAEATSAFGAPIAVNLLARMTGGYAVPLMTLAAVTLAGAGLFHWGRRQPTTDDMPVLSYQ